MMKQCWVIILFLVSCREKSVDSAGYSTTGYLLKAEMQQDKEFYQEFNIFKRQGIAQLTGDTLYFPFLAIRSTNDSIIEVTLFSEYNTTVYEIPKDDRVCYRFHNVNDRPRHVFTKISGDTIISYGYNYTLKELEESGFESINWDEIVPSEIKIITKDSIYSSYFGHCLAIPEGNNSDFQVALKDVGHYWIEPFKANMKSGCRYKVSSTNDERIQKAENFQYWYQHYRKIADLK